MKKVVYVIACIALVLSLGIVTCAASGGGYSPKAKVSGMGLTIKPIVIDVRAEVLASMVEDVHLNNPATSRSVSYYDAMLMQRKPVYSLTGEEMFDLFYEGCTPEGKQEIIDGFKIYKEPVLTYAVESDELALYSFTTEESEAQIK